MKRISKWLAALFCAALLLSAFPVTAGADMGPKPSVTVDFENVGDEICYATLLSDKPGNGPWIAWDGTPKTEFYAVGENHAASTGRVPYEIWKAFVDHRDEDGYYFLQFADRVDESGTLHWSYYPPENFKILLYYPESGRFAVSGIIHRYPYYARYQVDLRYGSAEQLRAERGYSRGRILLSFLFRLALTLVVEMEIARIFSIREKEQLCFIAVVNIVTHFLLNLLLVLPIGTGLSPYLPWLELGIAALEALAYCLFLNKYVYRPRKAGLYIAYALVANAASFGLGLAVSVFVPGMF